MPDSVICDRTPTLSESARWCLAQSDPAQKCAALAALNQREKLPVGGAPRQFTVGRPARPVLVDPRHLPRRTLGSRDGHGAFVHAICHIEFTAINLALDAVVRFPGMPEKFYRDWFDVACEEALHFSWLEKHLGSLGYTYGDFPAHNGLWDMAERTANDVLYRMALVPRVLEARGLDVTPAMIRRLAAIEDNTGARILERILADEIGHVAIGSYWFKYCCEQRALDPFATFNDAIAQEFGGLRSQKFNLAARRAAGFTEQELAALATKPN